MKFSEIIRKISNLFKKRDGGKKDEKKKDYSIRTVEFRFSDVPRSIYLVIKKYGWVAFFQKSAIILKKYPYGKKFTYYKGRTKGFFQKYSRKAINIFKVVYAAYEREGFANTAKRSLNIFLQKVMLRKNSIYFISKNENGVVLSEYEQWILKNERLDKVKIAWKMENFAFKPKISIILRVADADEILLRKAIFSIVNQEYKKWELLIVQKESTRKIIKKILLNFERGDSRIRNIFSKEGSNISSEMNNAVRIVTGDYISFMSQHDTLSSDAFFESVKLFNKNPSLDLIYSDEDEISENEVRSNYNFKPDWSPEFLLSNNYIGNFALAKKNIVEEVDGFREDFDGAYIYDFLLRLSEKTDRIGHISKILYHNRTSIKPIRISEKNKLFNDRRLALNEAFKRRKIIGEATALSIEKDNLDVYGIKFNPDDFLEKVTIIIPTKDRIDLLKRCIESIREKTNYKNYDVLVVDNNSDKNETFEYLKKENINFVSIPTEKFNYAEIHNKAIKMIDTELVLFLNNDTEVISPDWLLNMVGTIAINENIGAVGAKLVYGDKKVQHCGVIVGLSDLTAGHANKMIDYKEQGYRNYNLAMRNYSAVTAACMLTKKSLFEKVGGFDEKNLAVAFNDVDYCLKLISFGYRIVCNPSALLFHHESKSRGELGHNIEEPKYFRKKWSNITRNDPFYNINLSLKNGNYKLKIN
jgi:O-antigen biosynthesis protein